MEWNTDMKLRSTGAAFAGVALVAGSVLLGAAPASAETIVTTVPTPVPAETSPYSGGWFAGDVSGGNGSATQSAAGLEIVGGAAGYQLLNGDPAVAGTVTLAAATGLGVSTTGGDAFYQVSVFGEPTSDGDKQFTTLRPVVAGDLAGNWVNSRAIGATPAGTEAPLDTHVALLDAGEPAQVLAYGVFVNAGETVTVRAIGWNGDNFLFAAAPTATATPSSVAVSDTTTAVTIIGSGFAPGETVIIGVSAPSSGGTEEVVADADGNAIIAFTGAPGEIGDYSFTFSDVSALFQATTTFSVVADAVVTPAAPTLPNTGVDPSTATIGAVVLLVSGAGFLLYSMRRKALAKA
ncbi:LPXTG-motif cell wall-anchored protein [Salinibacterium sp. CAN_S4]|uniref:LPXTG cell wall anchor domain-containing protein n=1 Tax=Salinibacterium sp. CAN_S4 TaxID=2787727 RepID=UPI0018F04A4F